MMRVITVVLPPDAAKSEVADIEIASNASIYSLKEKILEVSNFNYHLKTKDLTLLTGPVSPKSQSLLINPWLLWSQRR